MTRLELRGHRGPGKTWRFDADGRPYCGPAWDGDGAPVYRPTGTLVPAPMNLRVSFALVEAQASDWRYRLPEGRP